MPGTRRLSLTPSIAQREQKATPDSFADVPPWPSAKRAPSPKFWEHMRHRSSITTFHDYRPSTSLASPRSTHSYRSLLKQNDPPRESKQWIEPRRPMSSLSFVRQKGSDTCVPGKFTQTLGQDAKHDLDNGAAIGLGLHVAGGPSEPSVSAHATGPLAYKAKEKFDGEERMLDQAETSHRLRAEPAPLASPEPQSPDMNVYAPNMAALSPEARPAPLPSLTGLHGLPMLGAAIPSTQPAVLNADKSQQAINPTRPATTLALYDLMPTTASTEAVAGVWADRSRSNDPSWPHKDTAEWLGGPTEAQARARERYMAQLAFHGMELDVALRDLCVRLTLRAEAQQIDRILNEFSKRYFVCNPAHLLGSVDAVHAVTFALLLLNTDLNTSQSDKMSREEFVDNTMATLHSIQTPVPPLVTVMQAEPIASPNLGVSTPQLYSDISRTQVELLLRNMYDRICTEPLGRLSRVSSFPVLRRETRSRPKGLLSRMRSRSLRAESSAASRSPSAEALETDPFPTLRGYVAHSVVYPKKRFGRPGATVYWGAVHPGRLVLYDADQTPYAEELPVNGACKEFSLVHAVADTVSASPEPYYAFDVVLVDGTQHRFQVSDDLQVRNWVQTILVHAARCTSVQAEPPEEGTDFGWACLDQPPPWQVTRSTHLWRRLFDRLGKSEKGTLPVWNPPPLALQPCDQSRDEQQACVAQHKRVLETLLQDHMNLREPLRAYWGNASAAVRLRALANWEARMNYLARELHKWTLYDRVLLPTA